MSCNLYPVGLWWDGAKGRARHDGVDRLLRRAPRLGERAALDRIEFNPALHVCRLAERACDPWRDMDPDEIEDAHLWLLRMSTAAYSFEG